MKSKNKEKTIWRKDAVIKITTLIKVTETPKDCFNNKEELINIDIDKKHSKTCCSFKFTKKGKKEALNFIKGELYWR